ncbi:MAG: ABC transporter permease [Trueperaceae bacterium]
MALYILRRLLNLIPTLILATFLAWWIIDLAPGDFASQFFLDERDPGKEERVREALGLDKPWYIRYFYWLGGAVTGDFGQSLRTKNDVTPLIVPRMQNSLILALPATLLAYLIAVPLGIYSALKKYSWGDRILTMVSLIGVALPLFFMGLIVVALLVQYFQSTGRFLLPVGGMTSDNYSSLNPFGKFGDFLWHLVAPLSVITLASLAGISRFMRGQMLEEISQDYIRTAKAKGLPERTVNYKHAFRNAIIVLVATIGSVLPALVSGAGSIEYVMRWPGLTPLLITAASSQDVYVTMAILTILTLLLVIGNLISDVALAMIDPRIRYS